MTPEQISRLIFMKEKAVRFWRARLQQRVFKEELAKKQETECNLAEFGSWIWGARTPTWSPARESP